MLAAVERGVTSSRGRRSWCCTVRGDRAVEVEGVDVVGRGDMRKQRQKELVLV